MSVRVAAWQTTLFLWKQNKLEPVLPSYSATVDTDPMWFSCWPLTYNAFEAINRALNLQVFAQWKSLFRITMFIFTLFLDFSTPLPSALTFSGRGYGLSTSLHTSVRILVSGGYLWNPLEDSFYIAHTSLKGCRCAFWSLWPLIYISEPKYLNPISIMSLYEESGRIKIILILNNYYITKTFVMISNGKKRFGLHGLYKHNTAL